jgi:hypothetical protein
MEMERLRLLANAGVPAVLLFYVIIPTVRNTRQLLTAIEGITDRFDRALARQETTVHEVAAAVLRLTKGQKDGSRFGGNLFRQNRLPHLHHLRRDQRSRGVPRPRNGR